MGADHRLVGGTRILVALLAMVTLAVPASASGDTADDGRRSFDWELGTWRTEVRVLAAPLSETEDEWLHFHGTSVVRPLMDRRANVVELRVAGPAGRIEGFNNWIAIDSRG